MRFLWRANRAFHAMAKSSSPARSHSPSRPASPPDLSSAQGPTSASGSGAGTKIYEGVFALNKPLHISSAQALRDLQAAFNPSRLFAPWVAEEERRKRAGAEADPRQRNRRRNRRGGGNKAVQVKMGHGGTLDPLATGVLIVGVGRGTKRLQDFLACSKEYRAALLFGAATDTYDRGGRVLGRAPHAHVTRAAVQAVLPRYTGRIMQRPPVYSALHMDGKRLYEYAREGKEPPKEIEERPTRVDRLEITAWLEPGSHPHRWPQERATSAERTFANKVLHLDEVAEKGPTTTSTLTATATAEEKEAADSNGTTQEGLKRKRKEEGGDERPEAFTDDDHAPATKKTKEGVGLGTSTGAATAEAAAEPAAAEPAEPEQSQLEGGHESAATSNLPAPSEENDLGPPAVELEMTVTSGFYVRSLCHDVGKAVGSLGMMASLVRTRQGDFSFEKGNVLEYGDLAKGEEVWGPKVQAMLEAWETKSESEIK